jgi:hypothetical protein
MGKHGHGKCHDVEACYPPGAAGGGKYPYMTENPQLRWAFIRKVYVIVCLQLLLTVAVAATVNLVRAIGDFFLSRTMGAMFAIIGVIVAPILGASAYIRVPLLPRVVSLTCTALHARTYTCPFNHHSFIHMDHRRCSRCAFLFLQKKKKKQNKKMQ